MISEQTYDNINRPAHYTEGRKYEPVDVITDWGLNFSLGNTVKYISRAGRKPSADMSIEAKAIEDLEKAKFYLEYEIKQRTDALVAECSTNT